jgi:hypothetical protein
VNAMARDVQETKQLILQRLHELRSQRLASVPDVPTESPPAPARAQRSRTGRWGRAKAPADADELGPRVHRLEERLRTLERLFIESPDRPNAPRAAQKSAGPATPQGAGAAAAAATGHATTSGESGYDSPSYQLTGAVKSGLLPDILQLLAQNQKTGRFSLFVPERQGRLDLFFRGGEMAHAKAGNLEGEAAFFAFMVAAQQQGIYGFLDGEETEKRTINGKAEFLILEALRRIDEERHGSTGGGG